MMKGYDRMYRILIADNDRLSQKAIEKMISHMEGFEVAAVTQTKEETLKYLRGNLVDILFVDVVEPVLEGVDIARQVYEEYPSTVIYTMMLYGNGSNMQDVLREIPKSYLEKPFSFLQFRTLLNNYRTEHEGSLHYPLEQLITIIKEKDFSRLYYSVAEVVDLIYDKADGDPVRLMDTLSYIGQSMINLPEFYDDKGAKSIGTLFPINEGLLQERKVSELWLFRVMNYIFQVVSVQRYPLLENVFDYIENHIKEDISLNNIVESCAVSQGYLSRIFKNQFGISVMEYLHMRKIYLAKGYFYFTEESVSEIAFKLGYNESGYFSKVFKKYEHMTVKDYRQSIKDKYTEEI